MAAKTAVLGKHVAWIVVLGIGLGGCGSAPPASAPTVHEDGDTGAAAEVDDAELVDAGAGSDVAIVDSGGQDDAPTKGTGTVIASKLFLLPGGQGGSFAAGQAGPPLWQLGVEPLTELDFGNVKLPATNTGNAGNQGDSVLVSLDPPGTVRWARRFGVANGHVSARAIRLGDGGAFIGFQIGAITAPGIGIDLGTGAIPLATPQVKPGNHVCWAYLDGAGASQWARCTAPEVYGKPGSANLWATAWHPGVGATLIGDVTGKRTFGEGFEIANNFNVSATYFVRTDAAGKVTALKPYVDPFGDTLLMLGGGTRAVMTADGTTIVAGGFRKTLYGTTTPSGSTFLYLAARDTAGEIIWTHTFGDPGSGKNDQELSGLALDPSGNVILYGTLRGTVDFAGKKLSSKGLGDIFVAKFDMSGNLLWARAFGSSANQMGGNGESLMAGAESGALYLTYYGARADDLPAESATWGSDHVVRLDPDGEPTWAEGGNVVRQISFDADGRLVAMAHVQDPPPSAGLHFGTTTLNWPNPAKGDPGDVGFVVLQP